MDDATIAALSTPHGRGGIAVVRISGKGTQKIIRTIVEKLPEKILSHKAYHSFIKKKGKRIEECVVVFFKSPHSYTGEDVAEVSLHSNPHIIEEVLSLIYKNKARCALQGEFTYRAFKNGKMDLIQAESVNELINANSRYYALMKFGSLEGKLSELVKRIRENLIELGIKIETKIEFEEDQFLKGIGINEELEKTENIIKKILSSSRFNEILNRGLNIVIVGKINVGKSSLFNTLLMEDRSIISSIPGTTRDFIKEKIFIDGLPVEITDVAGINRKSKDDVEVQSMGRSLEKIKESDAVVFMLDSSTEINETDFEIYNLIKRKKKVIVANKIDIVNQNVLKQIKSHFKNEKIHEVSVKKNINIERIILFLKGIVNSVKVGRDSFAVNQRQRHNLEELRLILNKVNGMIKNNSCNVEIIAEEIKNAIKVIGELTGEISSQDILHKIFSEFCIGK